MQAHRQQQEARLRARCSETPCLHAIHMAPKPECLATSKGGALLLYHYPLVPNVIDEGQGIQPKVLAGRCQALVLYLTFSHMVLHT